MLQKKKTPSTSDQILSIVQSIPYGRVTTYGDIAKEVAISAQMVGWLMSGKLKHNPEYAPWWRVVSKDGTITTFKLGLIGHEQVSRLKTEHIEFITENQVDMAKHRCSISKT
jgi:methylated-DNA-protein-cysteine methyltransferase related protein